MNAKELRFGNTVLLDGKEVNIDITQLCNFYYWQKNEKGYYPKRWEPVLLTEILLLKFGFYRHHADYSNGYILLKNVPFETDGFTFRLYPRELGSAEEPLEAQKIKYVHQLQNLYFAIIGFELQIEKDPMDELLPLKPR